MAPSRPGLPGAHLPRLTALRWFGALAVYLFHLPQMIGWRPLYLFQAGSAGVGFFFLLSGFVLTWSRRPGQSAGEFYLRRFARIYPAMTAVLVVVVVLAAVWPHAPVLTSWAGLVAAVLVVQAWFPGGYVSNKYNSVSWSISAEAFFYAVFPWLVGPVARRPPRVQVLAAAAAVLLALTATVLLQLFGPGQYVSYFNPLVRLAEFLCGVVLALRLQAGWRCGVGFRTAVGVTVVVALGVTVSGVFDLQTYLLLVPFGLLLAAAAQRDVDGVAGWLQHRWAVYLGEVSFCFYLVHLVVSESAVELLGWTGRRFGLLAGLGPVAVTLALSLGAAVALHHAVEMPAERLVRTRWLARRRP